MARFTRDELEAAFAHYNEVRVRCSETGDWSPYADLFREDAHYAEHAYGDMRGREAIRTWITRVMAPFPHMTFPQDWVVFDEERGAVLFQCQNHLAHPSDADHPGFGFPTWTRLVYAGEGLFASEEDVYNPVRDAPGVLREWRAAGGVFQTPELVQMKDR